MRTRPDTIPDQARDYVPGQYGEIAGTIEPNLFDRIIRGAEPDLPAERGPFTSDDDLLLAAFHSPQETGALKAAGPIRLEDTPAESPLLTPVKEIAARPVRSFHLSRRAAR